MYTWRKKYFLHRAQPVRERMMKISVNTIAAANDFLVLRIAGRQLKCSALDHSFQ
jgi:hypothetical protein